MAESFKPLMTNPSFLLLASSFAIGTAMYVQATTLNFFWDEFEKSLLGAVLFRRPLTNTGDVLSMRSVPPVYPHRAGRILLLFNCTLTCLLCLNSSIVSAIPRLSYPPFLVYRIPIPVSILN